MNAGGKQALFFPVAVFFYGGAERFAELGAVAEEAGDEPIEQGPQFGKIVLHRRSRQRDSLARLDFANAFGSLRGGILDRLGFVQNGELPLPSEQRLMVPAHQRVSRQDQMMVGDGVEPLSAFGAVEDQQLELRREARRLAPPVSDQARGHDQQTGAVAALRQVTFRQQRERLDGFPQPHVVGERAAESGVRQCAEPAVARFLVRTQFRFQRQRRFDFGRQRQGAQPIAEFE